MTLLLVLNNENWTIKWSCHCHLSKFCFKITPLAPETITPDTSILKVSMFVWQRLVIGPNKPTPFAVLAVRRYKTPGQNMAVTLRARNSVNTFTIKVIF